jgi:hypothetical protein
MFVNVPNLFAFGLRPGDRPAQVPGGRILKFARQFGMHQDPPFKSSLKTEYEATQIIPATFWASFRLPPPHVSFGDTRTYPPCAPPRVSRNI